jgi:hypothetical protein
MPRTKEILTNMPDVRAAFAARFPAFFHVTAYAYVASIRQHGLRPHKDATAPVDILSEINTSDILCLRPMGSDLSPIGMAKPPLITLAVISGDLPPRVGLDWSYSYELVRGRMKLYPNLPLSDFVNAIANELGSIVSYDTVPPESLRVRCVDCSDDPRTWPHLNSVSDEKILKHK